MVLFMNIFLIAIIILGFFILWFIYNLIHDPRTLASGASLLCVLIGYVVCIGLFYLWVADNFTEKYQLLLYVLNIVALFSIIIIIIFPFLFIITYFIQGIRLIRKEGLRFSNTLSLLLSFGLILYMIIYPKSTRLQSNICMELLFRIISISVTYLLLLFTVYSFTSFINLIHFNKKKPIDYIIVLGCGIFGDKITPLLAARVDKGLRILAHHPEAKIIFSGGQGDGEAISEAECMFRYALEKGIEESRMIKEDCSMNTEQNLKNSMNIIHDDKAKIVLVTTKYHVLRALIIAKQLHIKCIGYASHTKWYFSLNAELREFVGYLSISKKKHIEVLVLLTILEVALTIIIYLR